MKQRMTSTLEVGNSVEEKTGRTTERAVAAVWFLEVTRRFGDLAPGDDAWPLQTLCEPFEPKEVTRKLIAVTDLS